MSDRSMEFLVTTDLTTLPASIDFNFDALKAEMGERLERYRGLVVTEDSIKSAKDDRATLNKLKTAIDDKRKEVKKAYSAPYDAFEKKVKELLALVQEPIDAIDSQVKAFDDKRKQEKRAAIEHFYITNAGDLRELVPLDRILNPKWANQKPTTMEITQELIASIDKVRNELRIIKKMGLPFEDQIVDTYLKTLDMGAALAEKSRLEQQKKALKAAASIGGETAPPPTPAAELTEQSPRESVERQAIDFRVFVTEQEKAMLRQFLLANGIKYSRVPTDSEGRVQQWQQHRTA